MATQAADMASDFKNITSKWRQSLLMWMALVAVLIGSFWPTVKSLLDIWNNNVAFGHCLLIAPIIAWLVWQRRHYVMQVEPQVWPIGLILLSLSAVLWLVGWAGRINVVQHAAFVFMLQSTIPLIFGRHVTRAVLFPWLFAVFMIPVGDQFVPYLQHVTVWFVIKLLTLFQVPFTLDGTFFHVPNGNFQVAEACSGIRYLTSMVAVAAVFANIAFQNVWRRATVMLMSIALPIVANGIRAWGIIYLAYVSGNKLAMGIDHILYGWVFFALVMVLFIFICRMFSDKPVDDPAMDIKPVLAARALLAPPRISPWTISIAGIIIISGIVGYSRMLENRAPTLVLTGIKPFSISGWHEAAPADAVDWKPVYRNIDAEKQTVLIDDAGHRVTFYLGVYTSQTIDKNLITYGNGAFTFSEDGSTWAWTANTKTPLLANTPQPWSYTMYKDRVVRDVWQWFLVGGKIYSSPTRAKIAAALTRLEGGRTEASTLILSSERLDSQQSREADLLKMSRSIGSVQPKIYEWLGIPAGSLEN